MARVLQGFFCEAGSLGWRDREIDLQEQSYRGGSCSGSEFNNVIVTRTEDFQDPHSPQSYHRNYLSYPELSQLPWEGGLDVKGRILQLKEMQVTRSGTGFVGPPSTEAGKTGLLHWAEEDLRPLMPQRDS